MIERLEVRFVICPACEGEGRWEVSSGRYDPRDGALITEERICKTCGGEGEIEDAPEPRTLDDMETPP